MQRGLSAIAELLVNTVLRLPYHMGNKESTVINDYNITFILRWQLGQWIKTYSRTE